ncbi:hypothetical protein [Enterovibrio coralii]|nr:hypothetical protein [Enterovibrio coralii]
MTRTYQALKSASQPLVIAEGNIGIIAQGLIEESGVLTPSGNGLVLGSFNKTYISGWLAEITSPTEAFSLTKDERDPLPELSATTPVQVLLHWLAAAFSRLEPPPSQTTERNSELRDWLATQALNQEPPRPELHFRAEIALD